MLPKLIPTQKENKANLAHPTYWYRTNPGLYNTSSYIATIRLQICAHRSVESVFNDDMSFTRSAFDVIQICIIISKYLLPALSCKLFVGKSKMRGGRQSLAIWERMLFLFAAAHPGYENSILPSGKNYSDDSSSTRSSSSSSSISESV
jgi:hypothetical protein